MKKIYLVATALAALVSCSSDDFVGDASPTPGDEEVGEAILFDFDIQKTTVPTKSVPMLQRPCKTSSLSMVPSILLPRLLLPPTTRSRSRTMWWNTQLIQQVKRHPTLTTGNMLEYTLCKLQKYLLQLHLKVLSIGTIVQQMVIPSMVLHQRRDIATNNLVTVTKTTTGTTVYDKGYSVVDQKWC